MKYADDDASDSINVFNRNLVDTDDDDDGTTTMHGDYSEWTGSSI